MPAPNDLDATTLGLLDKWVQDDAPRLDADNNGFYDSPGPAIMDTLWPKIADAVMGPVYGSLITDLDAIRPLDSDAGESYVDKDLRTLLGDPVKGPFNLHYCGAGSLTDCRASLWTALDQSAVSLSATYGARPQHLAQPSLANRLHARSHSPDDAHHEPTDIPTGHRAPEPAPFTLTERAGAAHTPWDSAKHVVGALHRARPLPVDLDGPGREREDLAEIDQLIWSHSTIELPGLAGHWWGVAVTRRR